jgi:endoglucanase
VPNTGGWQIWQTVTANIALTAGVQTLRVAATGAGLNINYMTFATAVPSTRIQAEAYSAMFGIQTETTTDAGGGADVGWTEVGDWMDYLVTVPAADVYTFDFRVASLVTTGSIQLRNQAGTTLATLAQGSTGGWQTWLTRSVTATLPAGAQTLRIYYTGAGLNINWFDITQGLKSAEEFSAVNYEFNVYPNPATEMITIEANSADFNVLEIHSISGALMLTEPISSPITEIKIGELKKGMYLITLKGKSLSTKKLIIQ